MELLDSLGERELIDWLALATIDAEDAKKRSEERELDALADDAMLQFRQSRGR